jgi:predicted GNAT family acetyltransferase
MNPITLKHRNNGRDAFTLEENGEELAFMEVGTSEDRLTVYHTEVAEKLKGEGIGVKLLEVMADYAREHNLKVLPLCSFVHTHFKKNKKAYSDIW